MQRQLRMTSIAQKSVGPYYDHSLEQQRDILSTAGVEAVVATRENTRYLFVSNPTKAKQVLGIK